MNQQDVDVFLREYKEICEEHGMYIETDNNGGFWVEQIDSDFNIDRYITELSHSW